MKKFLRTLRFDETDLRVFAVAAEPGEWAVSGAIEFAGLAAAALTGKTKQGFANGFLGLPSFGRSTFATVGEADADAIEVMQSTLTQRFLSDYGAPSEAEARAAAGEELAFIEDLCRDVPVNTVFTVRRLLLDDGELKEEFRRIAPPSGEAPHARLWIIEDASGEAP